MKKRLQEILHKYKVEAFKVAHSHDDLDELTDEALDFSKDILDNAYHYHFHKLPDANRAEIINMINNYTVEAILPPVVAKIMRRIVVLEHQHKALLGAIEDVCEELGD
ncbi:MAG: hypothetical protein QGG14_10860 [Planctomycetota bacterium]|jgi:hypothetical protein|nr:hypothetical protein [Planctomycetota bacterium]